jgi:hypothetical protein
MAGRDLWGGFLWDAEEFFISYMATCAIPNLNNRLFLIGHSVELFLKAIRINQINDINQAMREGHDVRSLFGKCQAGPTPFMPSFSFKGTFEELYGISEKVNKHLTDNLINIKNITITDCLTEDEKEKYVHFIENQEFYLISENLINLKYFHSPWKPQKGSRFFQLKGINIVTMYPNPFWIEFVKNAYNYLGYNSGQIKERLEAYNDGLSMKSKSWLSWSL